MKTTKPFLYSFRNHIHPPVWKEKRVLKGTKPEIGWTKDTCNQVLGCDTSQSSVRQCFCWPRTFVDILTTCSWWRKQVVHVGTLQTDASMWSIIFLILSCLHPIRVYHQLLSLDIYIYNSDTVFLWYLLVYRSTCPKIKFLCESVTPRRICLKTRRHCEARHITVVSQGNWAVQRVDRSNFISQECKWNPISSVYSPYQGFH